MYLYYHPQCSKSRAALELLRDAGHEPTVIDYLATPPDEKTLNALLDALAQAPAALVRTEDAVFAQIGGAVSDLDRERVIVILSAQPELMQRPVLVVDERVIIARPPERVFELVNRQSPSMD